MKLSIFALAVFLWVSAASANAQEKSAVNSTKLWLGLAVAGEGVSLADATLTKQGLERGGVTEADPFARPFVHLPTPEYYGVAITGSAAASWLGWRMKNSHNRALRKIWFLPQVAQIAANFWGISTWLGMDTPRSGFGHIPRRRR